MLLIAQPVWSRYPAFPADGGIRKIRIFELIRIRAAGTGKLLSWCQQR